MKKLMAGLLTAALVLSFGTVSASAHQHHRTALNSVCGGLQTGCIRPACIGKWDGGHYCWDGHYCVDADNDGICDNYGHTHCPGNGVCGSYADADGDGVCDNYDPEYCPGNGTGGGNGNGSGYVDAGNVSGTTNSGGVPQGNHGGHHTGGGRGHGRHCS